MAIDELVRLDIPAQPAFVGVARAVVATVATSVEGIDDDRLDDLRLAVSEVCTNAVDNGSTPSNRVVVRCVVDEEHLAVHIEDADGGFSEDALGEGGFGLQLINALVDEVVFSQDGGAAVTLRMRLTQ